MQSPKDGGKLTVAACRGHLDHWWGGRIADNIRVIKGIKAGGGALFDIYEDQYDRFMDIFEHLIQQEGDRLDFKVERCSELPELAEDDMTGSGAGGWRTDSNSDQNYNGGGSQGGFYQN